MWTCVSVSVCVCVRKRGRFPVVLPGDLKKTLLTPDKRRFVSESRVRGEKVSGGECGVRLSLFSLSFWPPFDHFFHFLRFTNVWMPLMRNQDHSRGPQWSRSCDNPLFRCWPAVEIWAGFHWNCMSKCGTVCHLFSLTWNLLNYNNNDNKSSPTNQTCVILHWSQRQIWGDNVWFGCWRNKMLQPAHNMISCMETSAAKLLQWLVQCPCSRPNGY